MAKQSLAVKYRPKTFADVTEQGAVKTILERQLQSGGVKNAYLFCGGAGTGKTTCARIFANEINKGKGSPVELDGASNNSVDDVRLIIEQSQRQSLDSDYRIYIIDECHSLSNNAWQAFLKLLEEPPTTAVFIFCTTDPQKIPKTILSRVQRFDFSRISQQGIVNRLSDILYYEGIPQPKDGINAIEYIAKIADGGMRDAITLMDKCLAYSTDLTLENVVSAIGAVDYEQMFSLTDKLYAKSPKEVLQIIEALHEKGKDLKLFLKSYTEFILDICKFFEMESLAYTKLPNYYEDDLKAKDKGYFEMCQSMLFILIRLNSEIKWDTNPKAMLEANLYRICLEG